LEQPFCVALDRESVGAAEVDVAVADRTDRAQRLDREPGRSPLGFAIDGTLQALGVGGRVLFVLGVTVSRSSASEINQLETPRSLRSLADVTV